ncbi:MAG: amidohydrolase [Clostridiales bacterium]|nr:MAG: amidohydrolase [Clostridiales bacterium]
MLIINANIKTMEDEDFENGYIAVSDGKIQSVGPMSEAPPDEDVYDAQGMTLYPGFIDAHCHLGMWEDGLGFEGDDGNEETDPVTPQLRAIDAINPLDRTFREAVEGGITTVLTGPGSANPIGGQWAAIKTRGRRIDDMILKEPVGMKFALGENPKSVYNDKNQAPNTRMATAALIREQLKKAQRYLEDLERIEEDGDCDEPEYDIKCEALLPVLRKEQKAFFHAHRADDIFTAVRIAKEFDLDLVLCHCTEGHLIADLLKEEGYGVIAGPILGDRSKPELRNLERSGLAKLSREGIQAGLCTDHPETPIQYLPLCAGVAVGAGLDYKEALKAITIYPARIVGIDDRVGSIKAGKDADFLLYDGDPLSPYHHPKQVFINGEKCL